MLKDKLVLGMLVGLLADAAKLVSNFIAFKLNFTSVVFWQLIAAMMLKKEDIFTPAGILIGGIADIVVTMFFGVLFIYVIYFTGKENLLIKGIGFGMLVWVSIFGVLLQQLIRGKIPQEPSGILVTVVAHLIFGLSLGIFTKLLAGNLSTYKEETKQPAKSKKKNHLSLRPMRKLEVKKTRFKKPQKI